MPSDLLSHALPNAAHAECVTQLGRRADQLSLSPGQVMGSGWRAVSPRELDAAAARAVPGWVALLWNRVLDRIVGLLGGYVEWEVQTTEPDGCYRTWSSGMLMTDTFMEMGRCAAAGERYNRFMSDHHVKWRVQRTIVLGTYPLRGR